MTGAEFVGALVFFLSPPLDFCDACGRAYDKEALYEGLSPKDAPKPTCKARCLGCVPWGTLAAVCFLLGGLSYMLSAALDGISTMCDLNIIENTTKLCVVANDENITSDSPEVLNESWPDFLNDLGNTAGGACFVIVACCCNRVWCAVVCFVLIIPSR